MNKDDYKWTVYRHVGPTAKVYVGITCQTPQSRWGEDGPDIKVALKYGMQFKSMVGIHLDMKLSPKD